MVAENIKNAKVASLARAVEKDIDRAYEAVKGAELPMIHTFIATSDIHMQYKLKMKEDQVLERAISMVKYAKKYCNDVEFSAEDASRSRKEFLLKIIEEVIKAGATAINIPDTVGYAIPYEFGRLIKEIKENVPNIDKVDLSVHCHNDLGMAVSNSLEALKNGANQIECTINGLGERAGNAAMEEIIMAVNTRRDYFNIDHNIDTTQIYRTSFRVVSSFTGINVQPNKAIVGDNAFAHESGIHQHGVLANTITYEIMTPESIGLVKNKMVLGKLSGKHAFEDHLKEMGYTLSKEAIAKAFDKFKILADKKKNIDDRDIEALIEEKVSEVDEYIELGTFQINSGNKLIATSVIGLNIEGNEYDEAATGDGPIDASYNAIGRILGINLKLEEYKLRSVTGGQDALGDVNVRVSYNGTSFTGKGLSTDIIEASIKAYINTVNRIISHFGKDIIKLNQ